MDYVIGLATWQRTQFPEVFEASWGWIEKTDVTSATSLTQKNFKPLKKYLVKLGTLSQQGGRVPLHYHMCPNLENNIIRID